MATAGTTGALSAVVAATGALSPAKKSYPTSEVRGRSREDPVPKGRQPIGVTPCLRSGAAAKSARLQQCRNGREELPCVQGRGSGQECQAETAQEWPRRATVCPRSGAVAERRYPANEVRGGSWEELPHAPTPDARGSGREELTHTQGAVAVREQEGLEELLHVQGQEGQW